MLHNRLPALVEILIGSNVLTVLLEDRRVGVAFDELAVLGCRAVAPDCTRFTGLGAVLVEAGRVSAAQVLGVDAPVGRERVAFGAGIGIACVVIGEVLYVIGWARSLVESPANSSPPISLKCCAARTVARKTRVMARLLFLRKLAIVLWSGAN